MSESFPPPGYVKTKSAVSGIEVYMPRPPEEDHREVMDFRCPNCDGATAYSTDNGGLTCSFCGYHDAPQKEIVGKGAEEFEFTVETVGACRQRLGARAQGTGLQQLCRPHYHLYGDAQPHLPLLRLQCGGAN